MPRPDWPATIMEFQERFASEAACLDYLAASRWPEGFVCPACGGRQAWVLERRHLWECADCHRQTSVTAGTVMHGTRTPLRTWFWAAYLVATHHPGISAKQLQRQLGLSRYETAWLILQKLRRAMVAPEREALRGEVEIDEFFLGGYEEGLRGSRQRGKKALSGSRSRSAAGARGGFGWPSCPTPRRFRSSPSRTRPPSAGRSSTPTAGRATPGSRNSAMTIAAAANSPSLASNCSRGRTAPSQTSRRGCTAPTAASVIPTCRSISTSTSSATTGAAPRWPPSKPCWGSGRTAHQRPTTRSAGEPRQQPEPTGYALTAYTTNNSDSPLARPGSAPFTAAVSAGAQPRRRQTAR